MSLGRKYSQRHQKCHGCGKRFIGSYSHTLYCPTCARFAIRMAAKKFGAQTVKYLWDYVRKHGFVCYYTGMLLEMTDIHSAWYEFWYIIRQLNNHHGRHTKVRKIKLAFWEKDHTVINDRGLEAIAGLSGKPSVNAHPCSICGKTVFIYNAKYCPQCAKFAARLHSKGLPPETIEDTLNYVRQYGYICEYSGIALEVSDPRSPWYWELDHWIPQDPGKIVLTCALFNVMKSDLSEGEFWYYLRQFADFKEKGKKVRRKKLAYWWRLCPPEDG
jgi:hypothetical protein